MNSFDSWHCCALRWSQRANVKDSQIAVPPIFWPLIFYCCTCYWRFFASASLGGLMKLVSAAGPRPKMRLNRTVEMRADKRVAIQQQQQ